MRTRRLLVLWATTLAVAFVAFASPASHVAATVPPTVPVPTPVDPGADDLVESWALAPAASDDPNQAGNRADLSYLSDAGSVIDDAVTVYNLGTVPLTFKVYATDAFNDEAGQFALLPGDQPPVDVGTWVTFPQENLTVLPGQQATMPIVITIPADATPGDHVGGILASSPTLGTGQQGEVLTLDRRTGSRLYVRVNGDLVPQLAVDNVKTEYHHAANPLGGSATTSFRISNRGNIRLSGTPTVAIAGPFGVLERKISLAEIAELLPGEDVVLTTEVTDVPAAMFDYTTVRIQPHGSTETGELSEPVGKSSTFAPPLTILVVALLLVIVLIVTRQRRRRDVTSPGLPELAAAGRPELERQHQPT